ncbi:MAG: nucleotidyltransferase family protein [Chitinophagaceae bacterium]|nr:nucleotidyltransferase family protein [Chitinophagaceae bacterium]
MTTQQKSNPLLKEMKAMIFAAGLGTRLKPFTDKHPKALAPVNGKTLLQRNIEYLNSFGITDFIVNVHHFADQVIRHLDEHKNFGCNVTISYEKDEPLETGGGLKWAGWFFKHSNNPFVVMNADILTNLDINKMLQFHLQHKPLATLAVTGRHTSRNFLYDNNNILCGWINNKTGEKRISKQCDPLHQGAFTCVHIIEPSLLSLIKQEGKFSIIDTYLEIAKDHTICCYPHNGDIIVDVGRPESVEEAEKYFY